MIDIPLINLTRFNYKVPEYQKKVGIEDPGKYLLWCKTRSRIFRELTLPSLQAQYDKPDLWIIIFDVEINPYIQEVMDAIKPFDYIQALFLDQTQDPLDEIKHAINQWRSECDFIATMRVDSDDLLHGSFVRGIRKWITENRTSLSKEKLYQLVYPGGATYDVKNHEMFYDSYPYNQFPVLIESAERYTTPDLKVTVLQKSHVLLHEGAEYIPLRSFGPMWITVVHDCNVGNRVYDNQCALSNIDKILLKCGLSAR